MRSYTGLTLLTFVMVVSPLTAHRLPLFEVGGGANLTMPRQEYRSGWGIGLDGVWNFSRRYGINLAYSSTNVRSQMAQGSRTIASLAGSLEISFPPGDFAHGFTSIGLAEVSGEPDALFLFGIGIKIPLKRRLLVRLELRDYFTRLGIPFATFPGGRMALQGTGTSKYIELGVGLAYTFGQREIGDRARRRGYRR
ncbi:MAG: hypothetical protein ACE5GH_04970 [Fidelibacterota bacterium]